MRKTLWAVALVIGSTVTAQAGVLSLSCGGYGNGFSCSMIESHPQPGAIARIIQVPEHAVDDQVWSNFCKPVLGRDRFGVVRYSYAHEGCEYGRDR